MTGRPLAAPRAAGGVTRREVGAALLLATALIAGVIVLPPVVAGGAALAVGALYLARSRVFTWPTLLFALAATIMFIPVRRYALPIPLPFALEPYRVLIAVALIAVAVALLTRRPGLARARVPFLVPTLAFLAGMAISLVANVVDLTRAELVTGAISGIAQLAFLFSIAFVVRQLLTEEHRVEALLTFLVWAGVVVAFFAVVERLLKVNVFLLFGNVLPLILLRDESQSLRAGGARSYASSQHPIALAVLLCILIPLALYLSAYATRPRSLVTRKLIYSFAIAVLFAGMMTAVSRTGIVVLAVMFLITLLLRPQLALLLGLLALPLATLGALILPSVFESMVLSFLDFDSLIESQYASPGLPGQGRLADLAPAMEEFRAEPFLGTGPGSRIVVGADANSYILDNQVLGTLLETGVVGVLGLAIMMVVPPLLLLARSIRPDAEPRWAFLGFALATSMAGYVAAMFFYDAFAFIQTLMVLMILFAVGGWLLDEKLPRGPRPRRAEVREPAVARR